MITKITMIIKITKITMITKITKITKIHKISKITKIIKILFLGNVLSHPGLANLWQPDTHLLNGKKVSKPETITHIYSFGKVNTVTLGL
jgi:hypothetical protein